MRGARRSCPLLASLEFGAANTSVPGEDGPIFLVMTTSV